MQYKNNSVNFFKAAFARIAAIINILARIFLFQTMFYTILEYLFIANSKNKEFFNLVSIYFDIRKINGQKMIYYII